MQIQTMIALQSFKSDNPGSNREWGEKINNVWMEYMNLEFGLPYDKHKDVDRDLLHFYEKRVKTYKPKLKKSKDGKSASVEGLNDLFGK